MLRIACALCIIAVLTCSSGAAAAERPERPAPAVAVAWFTDAEIDQAIPMSNLGPSLPAAKGGWGAAVRLTTAVPVDCPILVQKDGYISFWVRPDWNGNDGKEHRILRIGDPETNGLLVEKAANNTLRYVMASPQKVTASRSDVSGWKAGQWHHVAIAWFSRDDMPVGLPLWIDHVCVDGPIASGNTFLDPAAMDDARIWIGDESADADMDELLVRAAPRSATEGQPMELVYRDYFRTMPLTAVRIDDQPHAVPADRRVVNGYYKQFGLQGELNGRWERLTEFVADYGNWTYFDAKPYITWTTSSDKVATADENGRVSGHALGRCTLTAEFRGLKATYPVRVIPLEQPDLDLCVVERQPRYLATAVKSMPAPGDTVRSVARIANFGFEPSPAGVPVTFELIPDANGNYRLDPDERPILRQNAAIDVALQPLDETTVEFTWTWPKTPVWVRVTVDPRNRLGEISEANNQLTELNTAKGMIWGYAANDPTDLYNKKRINLTGSFCYYDWMRAQSERIRLMLREGVFQTTSPVGVLDDIRIDDLMTFDPERHEGRPYDQHHEYEDGGFPVTLEKEEYLDSIWSGCVHELGHTMLALPDLYGHPVLARNVFITDENGTPYAGGPLLPEIRRSGLIMMSPGEDVECGTGYVPLMDYCHMWLHSSNAGKIQYYRGCRGPQFWGVQGLLIPTTRHELLVLDVNDEPLAGAAVYCYQTRNVDAEDPAAKFFADRPKYIGNTDETGCYVFPYETNEHWDSPDTDEVDGGFGTWNPFGLPTEDHPDTPNCWGVEGMMLLKIVSGSETEFHWLTLTMMNEEFFKGAKNEGTYTIRTSLKPTGAETPLVEREVPEAIREKNLQPVARVTLPAADPNAEPRTFASDDRGRGRERGRRRPAITVKVGQPVRIDGSASADPEGQPLVYRWHAHWPFAREYDFSDKPVYEGVAPDEPDDTEILFYVIDGVRESDTIRIRVHIVADDAAADDETADETEDAE